MIKYANSWHKHVTNIDMTRIHGAYGIKQKRGRKMVT